MNETNLDFPYGRKGCKANILSGKQNFFFVELIHLLLPLIRSLPY